MANRWRQPIRLGLGDVESWMAARTGELQRSVRETEIALERRRQQAVQSVKAGQEAIRSRVDVLAGAGRKAPPSRPLAQAALKSQPVRPASSQPVRTSMASSTWLDEAGAQLAAGARGAQDAFTFGLGDHVVAGVGALGEAARGEDFGRAYAANMAIERARDAYDADRYGKARVAGQVLGVGAQIAALGPLEGLVVGGVRLVQATPLILRETAALTGAGAAMGLGGQAVDDISHRRLGGAGDYVAVALGGATGALAARSGRVGQAGAVAGLTQSATQDVLNGGLSADSADKARAAAAFGALVGGTTGALGRIVSDRQSIKVKEQIGETASRIRTFARGDKTIAGPKTREYLSSGYTVPDQRSIRGGVVQDIVESKFGRAASLSKRQRQAYDELLNYRVDHTLPRDVGAALGLPLAVMTPDFWSAPAGLRQNPSLETLR